ncbi:MAG TPA: FeoB-associated Cys-rich membrane protein [Chryseolinea sp.]|nr:FeoB-associated Cys-rich membrane protein [Chryseolinea sp.]HPH45388.1 FeoB-associated Cys-rich membrane protein [Chryseolinea sp.]HPM29340.1 FeoB-associated Cys-rich membrane protein [Chryseolinea sp.]
MLQQIIIGILFLGALAYVGRLIYRSLQAKAACASACGKCGAVDFDKIEQQIQLKGLKNN